VLAVLAGCAAVGPNFQAPAAPANGRYTVSPLPEATTNAQSSNAAAARVPTSEAQRFLAGRRCAGPLVERASNSPELTRRIEMALAASPTVASARRCCARARKP